jgi:uncharacterized Zn-binding protein involved in type VI secretion
MPPAARITDMHTCPMVTGLVPHVGGPIVTGCPTVLTGFLPQARVTDTLVCVGPPDVIVKGSPTVLVGGLLAARIGDMTAHGGVIVTGLPTVLIGESGSGSSSSGSGTPAAFDMSELMASAASLSDPNQQAAALREAAKIGAAFCDVCKS